jgi:hypothetical protein
MENITSIDAYPFSNSPQFYLDLTWVKNPSENCAALAQV